MGAKLVSTERAVVQRKHAEIAGVSLNTGKKTNGENLAIAA